MGGKSGGGFDAGPIVEYGEKALDLNREIYNDNKELIQPYYEGGTGALSMLLDRLGVNGGSNQTRSQIYDDLKGDYTTQQTTGGGGPRVVTAPDGSVINLDMMHGPQRNEIGEIRKLYDAGDYDRLSDMGYMAMNPTTTSEVVDYDALNAAVDERFGSQGTPDNFGSLLETFDETKFREDPGYQFRLDEGQKAMERAAAARGQYYDPSTVKALAEFNAGQADQTYNQAYNRYNADQTNIFNRLAAVAGIGQTATGQQVNAGQNFANQASNIYGQIGSAQVEANAANASSPSMFGSLLNLGARGLGGYLAG